MRGARDKITARLDGMRLILESTPSDTELDRTLSDVDAELEAINRALDGNGSYLGIIDKVMSASSLESLRACLLVSSSMYIDAR